MTHQIVFLHRVIRTPAATEFRVFSSRSENNDTKNRKNVVLGPSREHTKFCCTTFSEYFVVFIEFSDIVFAVYLEEDSKSCEILVSCSC